MSFYVNGREIPNSGDYFKTNSKDMDYLKVNSKTVWEKIKELKLTMYRNGIQEAISGNWNMYLTRQMTQAEKNSIYGYWNEDDGEEDWSYIHSPDTNWTEVFPPLVDNPANYRGVPSLPNGNTTRGLSFLTSSDFIDISNYTHVRIRYQSYIAPWSKSNYTCLGIFNTNKQLVRFCSDYPVNGSGSHLLTYEPVIQNTDDSAKLNTYINVDWNHDYDDDGYGNEQQEETTGFTVKKYSYRQVYDEDDGWYYAWGDDTIFRIARHRDEDGRGSLVDAYYEADSVLGSILFKIATGQDKPSGNPNDVIIDKGYYITDTGSSKIKEIANAIIDYYKNEDTKHGCVVFNDNEEGIGPTGCIYVPLPNISKAAFAVTMGENGTNHGNSSIDFTDFSLIK